MSLLATIRSHLFPVRQDVAIAHGFYGQYCYQYADQPTDYSPHLIAGAVLIGLGVLNALPQHPARHSDQAQVLQQARAGEPMAEMQLALAYRNGRLGLRADHQVAAQWLSKAALAGNDYAAAMLGDAYASGDGVAQDAAAAERWWRLSAAHGNTHAQYQLGAAMVAGGSDLDPAALQTRRDNGYHWLGQAALQGDSDAQRLLGVDSPYASSSEMTTTRLSTVMHIVDPTSGSDIASLRKAALSGNSTAQYQLAMRYRDGAWGVEADTHQALAWLKLAANHGNALAMTTLATAYAKGSLGLSPDSTTAASWQARAAHIEQR